MAVCDVSCAGGNSCAALGADYACDHSYCRKALGDGSAGGGSSTASGGSSAGSSAASDCNPVGRYGVGKEGGYKPCCPGLTELFTYEQGYVNGESTPSCVSPDYRSFSCIQGFCGDGICEDAEAPCGCGVDCPDSNWRAHPSECEVYRDQTPPPDIREISITNTGSVQPPSPDCLNQYPLYELQRDGQAVNVADILFCGASCQKVMDDGWPYSDPRKGMPGPCQKDCPGPATVMIQAGQTLRQAVSLEVAAQQLPRGCAQGIATDNIDCFSRVIPQPGNYQLIVRAAHKLTWPEGQSAAPTTTASAARTRMAPAPTPCHGALVDRSRLHPSHQQLLPEPNLRDLCSVGSRRGKALSRPSLRRAPFLNRRSPLRRRSGCAPQKRVRASTWVVAAQRG